MLILATGDGIKSLNISSRAVADPKTLTGRNVTHLHLSPSGGLFAVLDGKEVWQGPNTDDPNGDGWIKVGVISQESANCLYALDGYVLVGTDAARLECIDLSGQAGSQIVAGFDEIDGRDEWFTPWGGSPDVRAFAGSGDHIYADIHVGWVCRSDDGGQTWTNHRNDLNADVHDIATHPDRPEMIAAATAEGFYRSDDAGESWVGALEVFGDRGYMRGLAIDCGDPDVMVITGSLGPHSSGPTGVEAMLFRTDDGGKKWQKCHNGLPEFFENQIDTHFLAFSSSTSEAMAFCDGDGTIYSTDDGALYWNVVASLDESISTLVYI